MDRALEYHRAILGRICRNGVGIQRSAWSECGLDPAFDFRRQLWPDCQLVADASDAFHSRRDFFRTCALEVPLDFTLDSDSSIRDARANTLCPRRNFDPDRRNNFARYFRIRLPSHQGQPYFDVVGEAEHIGDPLGVGLRPHLLLHAMHEAG